jgi:hypothetical protein
LVPAFHCGTAIHSAVIARLNLAIQYSETAAFHREASAYWIARLRGRRRPKTNLAPSRLGNIQALIFSRRALRPSYSIDSPSPDRGRRECRELAAPMARLQQK